MPKLDKAIKKIEIPGFNVAPVENVTSLVGKEFFMLATPFDII